MAIILQIFKGQKSIENFRASILRLKEDVAALTSVPKYQRSEVKAKIRQVIDKDLPKKTTGTFVRQKDGEGEGRREGKKGVVLLEALLGKGDLLTSTKSFMPTYHVSL